MTAEQETLEYLKERVFDLEGDVGSAEGAMEIVEKQIKRAGFANPRKHTNARGEVREVYVQTHNMVELVVTEMLRLQEQSKWHEMGSIGWRKEMVENMKGLPPIWYRICPGVSFEGFELRNFCIWGFLWKRTEIIYRDEVEWRVATVDPRHVVKRDNPRYVAN